MTWPVRHLTQSVARPTAEVAAFAGDPANLPQWAAGLSSGIRQEAGRWVADSPMGVVEVAFTGPIELGILDHDVRLPDGVVVHNPLRVLRNGDGSEVVFTLYRLPGVSEAEFERDAAMVREDLARLRAVLEGDAAVDAGSSAADTAEPVDVKALALNVAIPEHLQWRDVRRGEEFLLTTITVRRLPDGGLAAKAYGRPTAGGRGAYVSFAVPESPELAALIASAAVRAGELWAQEG